MKTIFYHKKKYLLLPDSFEELSKEQFISLAPLLFQGGEETYCQVAALRILAQIHPFRFRFFSPEIIDRCLPYVQWVFEKEQKPTLQLIPGYKGYYGPASGFDNLKMKEFHLSELYYRQLITEDEENTAIDHLIAVLYRKPRPFYNKKRDTAGDIRCEFNHNEVAYYAGKIRKWPEAVKQAIFLWYDGCRQELIEQNPAIFKEPSKHAFESQFDTGLYGMIRSLAGEKLGSVEKIESMYLHTAMLELNLIKEEEKYIEEQLKAGKKA